MRGLCHEAGLSPPVNNFIYCSKAVPLLWIICVIYVFVFVMLSRLIITALWSSAVKELTSWRLFVMSNCDFVTFPCGILGQVWYLIVLIPDLCHLSYFL